MFLVPGLELARKPLQRRLQALTIIGRDPDVIPVVSISLSERMVVVAAILELLCISQQAEPCKNFRYHWART